MPVNAPDVEDAVDTLHCGAVCEHDCTCSLPKGHDGDHKTRGSAGGELCSWPQDAAPDTAQPEDIPDSVLSCWKCGATEADVPLVDVGSFGRVLWRCSERRQCGVRQAAKASAR